MNLQQTVFHLSTLLAAGTLLTACASGSGGSAGDGGDGGDGGGGSQGPDIDSMTKQGTVSVHLGAAGVANVHAAFLPTPSCTVSVVGACRILNCGVSQFTESAGLITVAPGGSSVLLPPKPDGTYPSASFQWTSGPLAVQAQGAAVPPFQASVDPPTPLVVTGISVPVGAHGAAPPVSVQTPLSFLWQPTNDTVTVTLANLSDDGGVLSASCTAAGTTGRLEIPVDVLTAVRSNQVGAPGEQLGVSVIEIESGNETDIVNADWGIRVISTTSGATTTGVPTLFTVQLR